MLRSLDRRSGRRMNARRRRPQGKRKSAEEEEEEAGVRPSGRPSVRVCDGSVQGWRDISALRSRSGRGWPARGERARGPLIQTDPKEREREERGEERAIEAAAAAAIHDGRRRWSRWRPWRPGWCKALAPPLRLARSLAWLGLGRYRFAFKEDLIEGSEVGPHQLN